VIAITELARVHTEAYQKAVRQSGVAGHFVFNASPDELVCPECEDLDGNEYAVADDVPIPEHPQCRCYCTFQPDDSGNGAGTEESAEGD
jgi:SPP1 gp7 family putative phage head morphogenesis protein